MIHTLTMTPVSIRRRRFLGALSALTLYPALAACSQDAPEPLPFEGNDITGSGLGKDLAMPDTHGQMRTLADFHGKVLLVFFGYTQCPDVCPTAMIEISQAIELLGDRAKDVQVAMISVDPERDTPEILQAYVQLFNPNFIGLTGTPEQLDKTARSFKAFYAKEPGPTPDHYAMNHAAAFYLIDQQGRARALLGPSLTPEDMAHDIQLLLDAA